MSAPHDFYLAVGWTTPSSGYAHVTITALLEDQDTSGDTINAYLDTMVGSGMTAALDEVNRSLDISVPSGSDSTVTLLQRHCTRPPGSLCPVPGRAQHAYRFPRPKRSR